MHRSPSCRVIALLLAFLASFSAPGAAVAHGTAHHRAHHGDRAAPTSHVHEAHDHQGGHSHRDRGTADAVHGAHRPVARSLLVGRAVISRNEPDGSHGHPTFDLPVGPRVELAFVLPFLSVGALIATPQTEVTGSTRVTYAAFLRPHSNAAPPPRTRAPPLR